MRSVPLKEVISMYTGNSKKLGKLMTKSGFDYAEFVTEYDGAYIYELHHNDKSKDKTPIFARVTDDDAEIVWDVDVVLEISDKIANESPRKLTEEEKEDSDKAWEFFTNPDNIFAIYVGGMFKRPEGMILSVYGRDGKKEFPEVMELVGDEDCLDCLNELGIDIECDEFLETWDVLDIDDEDFCLLNKKMKMTGVESYDFGQAIHRALGDAGIMAWCERMGIEWKSSKFDRKDSEKMRDAIGKFLKKISK